jgi:hypothetical protein
MNVPSLILAVTDDVNPYVGKVIFGIVVFILWGAGAMASAVRKQRRQERARQQKMLSEVQQEMSARRNVTTPPPHRQRPDAARGHPAMPPPVPPQWLPAGARGVFDRRVPPPPPVPAIPVQHVAQPVAMRPKAKRRQQRPFAASAPPVPPVPRMQPAAPAAPRGQDVSSLPAADRPATAPANAVALHRWLTVGTLRSQFILTEILQPPLSLREPREL